MMLVARSLLAMLLFLGAGTIARADEEHHEGYYYPTPQTVETYEARVATLVDSDRTRRVGFVTGVTQQLLNNRYAPSYAVFAKGDEGEKMIIVGLVDGQLDTIYRARALFATLTAMARLTPVFRDNTVPEQATFFDLLKLLGFKQVTITDGVLFAHQVVIR